MSDWHDGMALDALRREVAERLRDESGGCECVGLRDVMEALGVTAIGHDCWPLGNGVFVISRVTSADVARLADLIDRPTCRAEARDGAARCSLCGAAWAVGALGYCPHCGARVEG